MDRRFFSKIIFCLLNLGTFPCWANCPLADSLFAKNQTTQAVFAMQLCALSRNDDDSQFKMAQAYEKGLYGVEKDPEEMIYYYQLAAESGHAEAQVRLAEIFMQYDKTPESRDKLLSYRSKIVAQDSENKRFNGDFMHPYALLLLAAESADKKWYYPSSVRLTPTRTLSLLRDYKIDPEKKKKALREASQWKTRKMLEVAQEVLPEDVYPDMVRRIKNKTTRQQAVEELKNYTQQYIQKNQQLKGKKNETVH